MHRSKAEPNRSRALSCHSRLGRRLKRMPGPAMFESRLCLFLDFHIPMHVRIYMVYCLYYMV